MRIKEAATQTGMRALASVGTLAGLVGVVVLMAWAASKGLEHGQKGVRPEEGQ